ncbi:MAG: hypothetical protein RR937_01315 [Ruthenibacterium sp.]
MMQKNVYSIVLMDDVVAEVDRIAYHAGTSRSNMMNRILAEYTKTDTPEQRMQDIFAAVNTAIAQQNILQPMLSASDVMLNLRSALQYKYNPSVRYVLELYPHTGAQMGELRVNLRTQNPNLLLCLTQFYRVWTKLESANLHGDARENTTENGRYTRRLQTPQDSENVQTYGKTIANYVTLFDTCLKVFFEHVDNPSEALCETEKIYKANLDTKTAEL